MPGYDIGLRPRPGQPSLRVLEARRGRGHALARQVPRTVDLPCCFGLVFKRPVRRGYGACTIGVSAARCALRPLRATEWH